MQTTVISDTHGQHRQLHLSGGDLLLHAGDVSKKGSKEEIEDFLDWFSQQKYTHKVFIAGNHDYYLETLSDQAEALQNLIPENIHYLNDSGVEIEGFRIWGSPIQPRFMRWAFQRSRGPEIAAHWAKIPEETDLLLVHGPAYGILDRTALLIRAGCKDLRKRLEEVQPKYFFFGHIHEANGQKRHGSSFCANVSVLNLRYRLVNQPLELNISL